MWDIIIFLFSGCANKLIRPIYNVVKNTIIPDCVPNDPNDYDVVIRPMKIEDCNNISLLANNVLGKGHGILPRTIQSWTAINSTIFTVAECINSKTKEKNICGYYSLVPITKYTINELKQGRIQDFSIRDDEILSWDDSELTEIYIMDVITTNSISCIFKKCHTIVGHMLLRHMISHIKHITQNNRNISKIFTITATKKGEYIATKRGFCNVSGYSSPFGWKLWERPTIN